MTAIHIHAPQPDAFGIQRSACPTCARRTYQIWTATPWYGIDCYCLHCGENWQDGVRAERPFAPKWREKSKAHARALYRRLKANPPMIVPGDGDA